MELIIIIVASDHDIVIIMYIHPGATSINMSSTLDMSSINSSTLGKGVSKIESIVEMTSTI